MLSFLNRTNEEKEIITHWDEFHTWRNMSFVKERLSLNNDSNDILVFIFFLKYFSHNTYWRCDEDILVWYFTTGSYFKMVKVSKTCVIKLPHTIVPITVTFTRSQFKTDVESRERKQIAFSKQYINKICFSFMKNSNITVMVWSGASYSVWNPHTNVIYYNLYCLYLKLHK